MLDLFYDFQKDFIVGKNKKYVVGDFSRGTGKTFSLVGVIFYHKPKKAVYINRLGIRKSFKNFQCCFKELMLKKEFKEQVKEIKCFRNFIEILWTNEEVSYIYDYSSTEFTDRRREFENIDIALYDDCLSTSVDISADRYFSTVSHNGFFDYILPVCNRNDTYIVYAGVNKMLENKIITKHKLKEIKDVAIDGFYREFDILFEYKDIENNKDIDINSVIDNQIEKLFKYLDTLDCSKTMSVKDTITSIEKLIKMKTVW